MILYKKDTKGKIRFLKIWADSGNLYQESGILKGKSIIHTKVCKGKNIGKSNETTSEEQSVLEMNSKIEEKLSEGYFKTIEECNTEEVILPMLAKSYEDEKHKIDWNNCYIQPKLDGMRCLAFINGKGGVKLMSRQGKEITTVPHIVKELSTITKEVILDGELYSYGDNFQENMRLIKKFRPLETDVKIQYHVYDLISNLPFHARKIREYIKGLFTCNEVNTYNCPNEQTLKELHSNNISNGYEGSIIRWGTEGYKVNGRSSNLLKYKDFQDIALKIIDITPNEANPLHGTPHFELRGKSFKSGVKMSYEDREDLLQNKNKYIGKTAEIRFFEYSENGIPRFPVMVGIRLDK
jgi:DNA ligase-1